jgi:hypothetical protein
LYRKFKNVNQNDNLFNRIYDTVQSVSYNILKNGVSFQTGVCQYNRNANLNNENFVQRASSLTSIEYEIYITNCIFTFIPTSSATEDTYAIYLAVVNNQNTTRQNGNLIMESYGFYSNTNIATQTITPTSGSNGLNYNVYAYTTDILIEYSTNTESSAITNNLITNNIYNQNDINTNNLNATTIIKNGTITSNGRIFMNNGFNSSGNNQLDNDLRF